jgi:hypothetical protein
MQEDKGRKIKLILFFLVVGWTNPVHIVIRNKFRRKNIPVLDQTVLIYQSKISVHELPYLCAPPFHATIGIRQMMTALSDIKDDKNETIQSLLQ